MHNNNNRYLFMFEVTQRAAFRGNLSLIKINTNTICNDMLNNSFNFYTTGTQYSAIGDLD